MATIFLSYRQESDAHRARVRALAEQLRTGGGLDVILDQFYFEAHPGGSSKGWEIWSEEQARDAGKVLIIASATYAASYNLDHPVGASYGAIPEARLLCSSSTTYELGGEYALWVRDHVMVAAATSPWLRVIVAGKETPASDLPEAIPWRESARRFRLRKLDWQEWKPLAQALRPDLDDEKLCELHGIVHGSHTFIHGALRLGVSSS